ncbi:MAG: glycosyltransferase family 2 protein [Anaerolineae bacterium]|nr:glycosyltransferase family 2 protein [Anaerolineae bacterium]MDW8172625.1 glycosyltransferase family 2 protein [Anaerolineae bacterium]
MNRADTLIILPAYNEAANIVRTLRALHEALPSADLLVVNDGSEDDTGALAEAAGATVLHLPYNLGIGAGVQTGFLYAQRQGYAVVARNDGDGQHAPAGLTSLLERLARGDVDMVIGSRFLGDDYGTPLARRLGIGLLSRLISGIVGQTITDPTSGYAAFNRRAIDLFARVYPHDYPEPEAIVIAHRSGLRLCEIPVTMRKREGGRSSITALRSAYYMLKVTLAILINLLRRPYRAT